MKSFVKNILPFFFSVFVLVSCGYTPKSSKIGTAGENFIALTKESLKAEVKRPKKNQYMYFKFTGNQKVRLMNSIEKLNGASLCLKIKFDSKYDSPTTECPFAFGFLYEDDFDEKNNLKNVIFSRNLITGDFSKCLSECFELVYSIAKNDVVPCGFFVYGTRPYAIKEAYFDAARIGRERNDECPVFAFGPLGGEVKWNYSDFSLAGSEYLFPVQNLPKSIMPKIVMEFTEIDDIGAYDAQAYVMVQIGDEKIKIRRSKNQDMVTLQASAFNENIASLKITENSNMVKSVFLCPNNSSLALDESLKVLEPIVTDLGLVIDWPEKNWRCKDYELFRWEQFPDVIFIDFKNYEIQNEFFTRLAFFSEKAGYKGTLVSDDFIREKHGYNAHDYSAKSLSEFFTKASLESFPLNDRELLLREILLKNKIIVKGNGGKYKEGKGALVSFSRESPVYLRYTFLAHECWHGIFFTNSDFRDFVTSCYYAFDEGSMNFIKNFWETQPSLNYDRNDEYLMKNEFMGYIMQQPLSKVAPYFLQIAGRGSVNRWQPEDAEYIRENGATHFHETAVSLNKYVFDHWGLACGRVNLISRQ